MAFERYSLSPQSSEIDTENNRMTPVVKTCTGTGLPLSYLRSPCHYHPINVPDLYFT